jgi:gliding motility-associated-like protein
VYAEIIGTEEQISDLRSGNPAQYDVVVTTGTGCTNTASIALESKTALSFSNLSAGLSDPFIYTGTNRSIEVCRNDTVILEAYPNQVLVYDQTTGTYNEQDVDTVYWKSGLNLFESGAIMDTAVIDSTVNSPYYYAARIEGNGCFFEDSVRVQVPDYPSVEASIIPNESGYDWVFEGGSIDIETNSVTDSTFFSWFEYWEVLNREPDMPTLPSYADSTDVRTIEVTNLIDSTWYVVTASTPAPYPLDNYYCVTKDSVKVRVMGEFNPPSAFSPNGDGVNDTWKILGVAEGFDFSLKIYNRWGQLIFESSDAGQMFEEGWDGTNRNGKNVTIGTYYYVIQYSDGNKTKKANGPVTVIR